MSSEMNLTNLRRQLAEAQITERNYADGLKLGRAYAEQKAIDAAGGEKALGSNAEARDRALTILLEGDSDYQIALSRARTCEAAVIRLTAELEAAKDIRREREWNIRDHLAAVLDRRGIQLDSEPEDDDAPEFLAAADDAVDDLIEEQPEIGRSENLDGQDDVDPNIGYPF